MPRQRELAGGVDVSVAVHALPRSARWFRRIGGDYPRAHIDRKTFVGGGDAELEHLGAEIVEVAADTRLWFDARVELIAALR